jgi:hypothetical protein
MERPEIVQPMIILVPKGNPCYLIFMVFDELYDSPHGGCGLPWGHVQKCWNN